MTSATDELRRLLDELGAEYTTDDRCRELFWNTGKSGTVRASAIGTNGLVQMIVTRITPEQAVEATLGRGDVEWDGDVLVLTLPRDPSSIHVRRADGGPRKVYPSEATLGKGTCRIEEQGCEWRCTGCGEVVGSWDPSSELCVSGNFVELWDYCPNCGRKVV